MTGAGRSHTELVVGMIALHLALPSSICHGSQIWRDSLVGVVGRARELTDIRMVTIKVLMIFSCRAELRRSFIYNELAGVSIDTQNSIILTIFFAGQKGTILTGSFLLSMKDNTS